jgi:hypothetical protein
MNRQHQLLKLFHNSKNQATLINGHGELYNSSGHKTVPEGKAIVFLAEPGTCMNIPVSLGIQNRYFTSARNFKTFLTGNRRGPNQYHHVSDILSRTSLAGNKYINMSINLRPDKKYKTMGFIKKIPTRPTAQNLTLANLRYPNLKPASRKLSQIVDQGESGIYVVSACRMNPNNSRQIMNLPKGGYYINAIKPQSRYTKFGKLIRSLPIHKPRPGVRWNKLLPLHPKGQYKRSVFRYPKKALIALSRGAPKKSIPAEVHMYAPKLVQALRSKTRSRVHRSGFVS